MLSSEVAEITNISIRTLHFYDEINLLKPNRDENNYRKYTNDDLDKLQEILLYRECGFSLDEIKKLMENNIDRIEALDLQKNILKYEIKKIKNMIDTINNTMDSIKEEKEMSNEKKFKFNFDENPYEDEARKLYGDKVVDKSNNYINSLNKGEKEEMGKDMDNLFTKLASLKDENPESEEVQKEIDNMYKFFNKNFSAYTLEAFAGLGKMYVEDERFTKNIDKYGEGLSKFLSKAMEIYSIKES